MTAGSSSKKVVYPLCLAFAAGRCGRKIRKLAPILRLHLSVELRERVEVDLADRWLDRAVILRRVVHENARTRQHLIRGGAHHGNDARWDFALPIRADHQIETRPGPILLSDLCEFIGTRVIKSVDSEAIAELRHLEDHRLLLQFEGADPIRNILVWAGDPV